MNKFKMLEKQIRNLCTCLHTELSNLQDPGEPLMSLTNILSLTPTEGLDHLMRICTDLIQMKRNFQMQEECDSCSSNQKYQKALQKLESEVRNHIKVEQQMKLLIEATQAKLEDTKKTQSNVTEKTKRECSRLTEKVQELEDKNSKLLMERNHVNPLFETSKKVTELESVNRRLELNLARYKGLMIDKNKEMNKLETKYKKLRQTLVQKENVPEMTVLEKYRRKYANRERHESCRKGTPLSSKERENLSTARSNSRIKNIGRPVSFQGSAISYRAENR